MNALPPVLKAMDDPLKTKTLTLSCGKLTTGVTVRPWTGILMLRNSSSPETYFQAAFRVQSPWTVVNPDDDAPNREEIIKQECYVFDFAPNRALRQIADYSCRLNVDETNPEKKVAEFINFLPVLAYDGSTMKEIDAAGILDIAMSGTSATLLARRWESGQMELKNTNNQKVENFVWAPCGKYYAFTQNNGTANLMVFTNGHQLCFEHRDTTYTRFDGLDWSVGETICPVEGTNSSENIFSRHFTIKQNYPNPFNASTLIEFSLPQTSSVELKIYNLAGQEVFTLMNEKLPQGNYKTNWNGRDKLGNVVSSGIYLYTLKTGNDVKTHKMTFLK